MCQGGALSLSQPELALKQLNLKSLAMQADLKLLAFSPPNKKTRKSGFLFGGGVTRTHEVRRRGIYSPLQLPLCDTPGKDKER